MRDGQKSERERQSDGEGEKERVEQLGNWMGRDLGGLGLAVVGRVYITGVP
jgi:hypothetical protein